MPYKYSYSNNHEQEIPPQDNLKDNNWFNVTGDIDDFIFYDDDEKICSER